MPRLTKRTVDTLNSHGKDKIVFDSDLPGFGVRLMASGRKVYLVQYRSGGRTRRITLGRHGTITPEEARTKARELLGAVAGGGNPAQSALSHRQAPTVNQVCERFMREHVAVRLKPSTQETYAWVVNRYIKPEFGPYKIVDVKRADIARLHHKLRNTPYNANRFLQVFSKMLNLTELWELRPDGSNPCRHVPKYRETKRERFLSAAELTRLGVALDELESEGTESLYIVGAFKLLILTGCRLGEIQTLKWDYIKDGYIELPDSKTGPRKIPLPPAAKDVLTFLPPVGTNEFVIVGEVEGQHITDMQKPWRRIRIRAGLEDVRIHDLRHTYASNAVKQGMSILMVGKLLGHTQYQTTMRYAHLADDPIREAAAQISGDLAAALGAKPALRQPNLRIV